MTPRKLWAPKRRNVHVPMRDKLILRRFYAWARRNKGAFISERKV
jgi:hypothetical protein